MKKYIIIGIFVLFIVFVVFIFMKDKPKEYPLGVETIEWDASKPDLVYFGDDPIKKDSLGNKLYFVHLQIGEAVILNKYMTREEYFNFLKTNYKNEILETEDNVNLSNNHVEPHKIKVESRDLQPYEFKSTDVEINDSPVAIPNVYSLDFNPPPVVSEKTFRSKYVENKVTVYANTFVDSMRARVNVNYELYFNDKIYPTVKENMKKERKKGRIEGFVVTVGSTLITFTLLDQLGVFDK